jgi:hypothetical protein
VVVADGDGASTDRAGLAAAVGEAGEVCGGDPPWCTGRAVAPLERYQAARQCVAETTAVRIGPRPAVQLDAATTPRITALAHIDFPAQRKLSPGGNNNFSPGRRGSGTSWQPGRFLSSDAWRTK